MGSTKKPSSRGSSADHGKSSSSATKKSSSSSKPSSSSKTSTHRSSSTSKPSSTSLSGAKTGSSSSLKPSGSSAGVSKPTPTSDKISSRPSANGTSGPTKSPSTTPSSTRPPVAQPAGTAKSLQSPAVAPGATRMPASSPSTGAVKAQGISSYGSMGPSGMGGGSSSMGPGGMSSMGPEGISSYGTMGPNQMGAPGSMNGYGSMGPGGMNGYGSMGPGSMNGYGSMGPGQMSAGSMYGMQNPSGIGGSMYGMESMGPGQMAGSMYGMGSMYGGNPMMGPMGSMYGGNPMMGSMYGGNPMMGSMYGMGGMGSMYGGMPTMGSMGPGSMYGSLYGRSLSFGSFGAGSLYGSRAGSMYSSGSAIGGMFAPPSNYSIRNRSGSGIPFFAKCLEESTKEEKEKKRKLVETTKAAATPAPSGDRSAPAGAGEKAGDAKKDATKPADDVKKPAGDTAKDGDKAKTRGIEVAVKKDGIDGEDKGVYGLVILENKYDATRVKADPAARKISVKDSTDKDVSYEMSEIIPAAEMSKPGRSTVLKDLNEHACLGHHVTAIVLNKDGVEGPIRAAEMLAESVMHDLSKDSVVSKWKVICRAAVMPTPTRCKDLQDPAAKEKDAALGSNPVCGPGLREVKTLTFTKGEETKAAAHFKKVLSTKTQPKDLLYVHLIFMQLRSGSAYLSSLVFFVTKSVEHLEAMTIGDDKKIPVSLLRSAIGGPGRTTIILPISGEKAAVATESSALKAVSTLCSKPNKSPRSGNTARFIEFTDVQIEKLKNATAKLTGPIKSRQEDMIVKLRAMVSDTKKVQDSFDTCEPEIYQSLSSGEGKAREEGGEQPVATPAVNKSREQAAPPAPGATAAATTPGKSVAVARAVTPAKGSAAVKDTTSAKADPFSSIHRIAVVLNGREGAVSQSVEVVVDGSKKSYDVNECITRPAAGSAPASVEAKRMANIFGRGYNVALLGAECVGAAPTKQVTWEYAKSIASDVLDASTVEASNELEMHMCVIAGDKLVGDLVADGAGAGPLVISSSPLVGSIVHNTKSVKLNKSADVPAAFDRCLKTAEPLMKGEGTFVVASLVLKQVRKEGTYVASMTVAASDSVKPYTDAVERSADKAHRGLFSFPLGGPCSTAVLAVVSHDQAKNKNADAVLAGQRTLARVRAPAPRVGDVKDFIAYVTSTIASAKEKLLTTKDPAEVARTEKMVKVWEGRLSDHRELLEKPTTSAVPFYTAEQSHDEKVEMPTTHNQALLRRAASTTAEASSAARAPTPQSTRTEIPARAVVANPRAAAASTASPQKPPTPQQQRMAEREKPAEADRHRELSPSKLKAASSTHEKPRGGGEAVPVKAVAVITETMSGSHKPLEGWHVGRDANTILVTDVEGIHQFEMDEVCERTKRGESIHSDVLDSIQSKFLAGENTAILTADGRGSSISLEVADSTVRRVMSKMGPTAELYISITAYREKEAIICDALAQDPNTDPATVPLHVSVSPLVGPHFKNQTTERITDVDAFVATMARALGVCTKMRSSAVLHLFLCNRRPEQNDVVVSNMLITMCPGGVQLYRLVLEQEPRMRGVLNAAVGGPCNTAVIVGLSKQPSADDSLDVCNIAKSMRTTVENSSTNVNSVRNAIEKCNRAISQAKGQRASADNDSKLKKIDYYISRMEKFVDNLTVYVNDPIDKPPPTSAPDSS